MTPPVTKVLEGIPNSSVDEIKDGARSIAENVVQETGTKPKTTADRVAANMRKILKSKDGQHGVSGDGIKEILGIAQKYRAEVIELLSEKECIRQIAGTSKREKQARVELANKVLDELVAKIKTEPRPQTVS